MDRDEAKNILQLCRPGNASDLNDPLIVEAFELLENNSALQVWFEDQQGFDKKVAANLEAIEPPADLKSSILAGMRAHQKKSVAPAVTDVPTTPSASVPPLASQPQPVSAHDTAPAASTTHKAWWHNPWVGIAAVFVLMLLIITVPRADDAQLAQNDQALSGLPPILPFLSDKIDGMTLFGFDKKNESAQELKTFLISSGAPAPKNLRAQLASMPTIGCVTFDFNGSQLSMICFKDGETYHLITADAADFPDACPKGPQLFEMRDKAFKVWIEDDQLNILTIHGTKNDIPEFI